MRLDRTVIVIGFFLFAIGLAVAWNGYGYVQLERGWTQVIAGTVAAGTGLVLVALGLILAELQTIAASAARATLLLAKVRNGLPAETPYAPPPPAYAPPLEEFEAPAAKTVEEAPAPLEPSEPRQDSPLSWMVRGNRTETSPDPKMPQAAASDAWLRQPLAGQAEEWVEQPVVAAPEPQPERSWDAVPPPHEPAHEPVPLTPQAPELATESVPEPVLEHRHEPAVEIPPATEPEPEIAPAPEPEPQPEPHVHEPANEIPREPAVDTVHEAPLEPATAEPTPEHLPKPEIIGHYDAQGTHYTLYADGSIEAETPHGVYRFASMAELKSFIEGQAAGT